MKLIRIEYFVRTDGRAQRRVAVPGPVRAAPGHPAPHPHHHPARALAGPAVD